MARRESLRRRIETSETLARALGRVLSVWIKLCHRTSRWDAQGLDALRADLARGPHIRLRQGNTGRRIMIPVGTPLKAGLDAKPKSAVTILTTTKNTSWTPDGFRTEWRKVVVKSGVLGRTFHDLRGTAVTRLAMAGCNESEIATFTGHSM